jgi:DNA processing protein
LLKNFTFGVKPSYVMEEWKYWLGLSFVPGIGDVASKNLISRFHNPEAVFEASTKALDRVEGIGEKAAQSIKNFSDWDRVDTEIQNLKRFGFELVSITDKDYPKNLSKIYYPPSILYLHGEICASDEIALAIVGTRAADRYGRLVTERLAAELASMGITIVSGMARGIDSVAHAAALKCGGRTIAVLGSGLDVIYPPENKNLYNQISENGAVISEFHLGSDPDAANFPKRNRVISGLSLGVLVIQASEKSGSLITASFALEQNREVFAVPGNIVSKLSRGTNALIKKGAKLVDSVEDILGEVDAFRRLQPAESTVDIGHILERLNQDGKRVFSTLRSEPTHIDDIIKQSGFEPHRVLSTLLSLELEGLITQLPGKMFQLR